MATEAHGNTRKMFFRFHGAVPMQDPDVFPVVPAEEPGPRNGCRDVWQGRSRVEVPDLAFGSSGTTT